MQNNISVNDTNTDIIDTCRRIEGMYDYCGYLSPEGVFYREKKIYESASIESDLYAWNLLRYVKAISKDKKKPDFLKQLRESFSSPDKALQNYYGFVKISDDDGIVSFSYNLDKLTDIQKDIVLELQTRYFGKNNTLKLKR